MSSYRQIFKATALLGGTQVLVTLVSIFRNKALAVLLGPAGVGIAGLYVSVTGLIGTFTGLGIGNSGVRQMAEASNDLDRAARVATSIRRVCLASNLIGALILCAFCRPLSRMTFGNYEFAGGVALMALVLICAGVSGYQMAILQGLRRVRDLANCQILGAIFGAVVSVTLVYFLRERGIAWFLVAGAVFGVLTSWWFARKIKLPAAKVTLSDTVQEAKALVGLGVAIMTSSLLAGGVAYFLRIIVSQKLGLSSVGQYQAAYTLSSYYVGFILVAMGTEFFPRLTSMAQDHSAANRLMNEQVEIGLLLAVPGIVATLVFAPFVLRIFYTRDFLAAAWIVQWQVLGVFFRMASWPLWHIQLAKGLGRLFIITESAAAVLQVLLTWLCVGAWGLDGVGIAFMIFYFLHAVAMYWLCRRLTGFVWSQRFFKVFLASMLVLGCAFAGIKMLPMKWGMILGTGLILLAGVGSLVGLQKVLKINFKAWITERFLSKAG
jgi:enterobacterial common antigen flippase